MRDFRIFLDIEAARELRTLSRSDRGHLEKFIDSLAGDPYQSGDITLRDEVGRPYQLKRVGRSWITYWVNHVDLEVKILKIEPRLRSSGR